MKVCPKCQASFAEGFVYCPRDAELLARYDLRAQVRARGECNFLLPAESFGQRLGRELAGAWRDLRDDPRGFCAALWRGEGNSRRRKQTLQAGVALALIVYSLVVTGLSLLGMKSAATAEQVATQVIREPFQTEVRLILPTVAKNEFTKGRDGHLGGSLAQPQRAHGGGGGGVPDSAAATRGNLPIASLAPQQRPPELTPPKLEHPTLIQTPSVVADPLVVKFVSGPTGLPSAPLNTLSKGAGTQGGLGGNDGTGAGPGIGPGVGPGNNGNTGGGSYALGGMPVTGRGDQHAAPRMADARLRPTILYREKARYTEEARQMKVQGAVILLATFTANGQIADIRVVRGQPYGLTEEAIQAAKRIRFQPASENGVPVPVRAHLEYNFALY